jgi:hypothetical protein
MRALMPLSPRGIEFCLSFELSPGRWTGLSFIGFGLERGGGISGVVDDDEVLVASCGEGDGECSPYLS